jgi:hypothetical protein
MTGASHRLLESCTARTHGNASSHLSIVKAEQYLYAQMLALEKLQQ